MTPSKFLVLSTQHWLLPIAQRLRSEGHEVDAVVWLSGKRHRYERAWEGVWPKLAVRGDKSLNSKVQEAMPQVARESGTTVVTDSFNASRDFSGVTKLYPSLRTEERPGGPLRLGGWFDGEQLQLPHVVLADLGVWPGGLGPGGLGGLTLVRVDRDEARSLYDRLLEPIMDHLKSSGFRGLCQFGVELATGSGEPRIRGAELGWPRFHTHAFVSELPETGQGLGWLLDGGSGGRLPRKFVVVLPVSIPPYPLRSSLPTPEVPVEGLTEQQRSRVFWHDIRVEQGVLKTAGLDGLVGVVRGAGDNLETARREAIQLAARFKLPEKQFRPDVAGAVPTVLAALEEELGLVL